MKHSAYVQQRNSKIHTRRKHRVDARYFIESKICKGMGEGEGNKSLNLPPVETVPSRREEYRGDDDMFE